jgi:hypothetical protein
MWADAREQLVENGVVDYQSGTVSRCRDAIQVKSVGRERRGRAGGTAGVAMAGTEIIILTLLGPISP